MTNPAPKFNWNNLSALQYRNGWTQWHLRADGVNPFDLTEPGFFAESGEVIRAGDLITAVVYDAYGQFVATGDLVCVQVSETEGALVLPKGKFIYAPANDVQRAA